MRVVDLATSRVRHRVDRANQPVPAIGHRMTGGLEHADASCPWLHGDAGVPDRAADRLRVEDQPDTDRVRRGAGARGSRDEPGHREQYSN